MAIGGSLRRVETTHLISNDFFQYLEWISRVEIGCISGKHVDKAAGTELRLMFISGPSFALKDLYCK